MGMRCNVGDYEDMKFSGLMFQAACELGLYSYDAEWGFDITREDVEYLLQEMIDIGNEPGTDVAAIDVAKFRALSIWHYNSKPGDTLSFW